MYRLLLLCVSISALVASVPIENPSQELVRDSGSDTSFTDPIDTQGFYGSPESATDQNLIATNVDTEGIDANPSSTDPDATASGNSGYIANGVQQNDYEPISTEEIADGYDCNDDTQ